MWLVTKRLKYLSLALLTLRVVTFLVLRLFSPIMPFASTEGAKSLWLWNQTSR